MGDFDELKKRIDVFLKEVKGFSSGIAGTNTEVENHQSRFVELRTQQNDFAKEVKEFQPAKKIFFFDSKKTSLVKSLQEEITKASKMMEKHKIPVPEEAPTEEEQPAAGAEENPAAAEAAAAPNDAEASAAKPDAAAAEPVAAPAPKPRQKAGEGNVEDGAADNGEEFEDEEEEEESEEFEEDDDAAVEEVAASATAASATAAAAAPPPKPAPRQAAEKPQPPAANDDDAEDAEDAEDDEEDVSDEEDDDMHSLASDEPNLYEVQQAYANPDPRMLGIGRGERLIVLRVGADGWWLARNTNGKEGLVPSTLLREVEESEEDDDEEEAEDDDDEEATESLTAPPLAAAAAAAGGKISTATEQHETESWMEDSDSETALTDSIESDDDLRELSLTQQMVSVGQLAPGLPAGFRASTLAKWFYEGHALPAQLAPKLTRSCLGYRELQFDHPTQQLKPLPSRVDKIMLLQKCTFMPAALSVNVSDRFIRMCLFDGRGPVSNVHTVRACVAPGGRDDRTWTFAGRLADSTPGLELGEAYLRYNHAPNHVRLLLEATVVCSEQSADTEKLVELSVGHVTVPLCDENGAPVPGRAFDLQLEGGTPFDEKIEVDPNLTKAGGQPTGLFKGAANKQPRIQLKFSAPSREVKDFMDTCPGTIIGSMAHLQLHSLYRHTLGSELGEGSRQLERSSAPIYGPCLVQFPAMVDQPDLMDLIRRRWNDFAKRERAFRRPLVTEVMKQEFIRLVKSTYFLNQIKDFQPYVFGNKAQEQARAHLVQDFQRRVATDPSGVSFSLCADFAFEPFCLQEVALSLLGPHSVPVIPVAVE